MAENLLLFIQDAEVQTYCFKLVPLCSLHGVYNSNKQRQLQQETCLLLLHALHSASTCLRLNKILWVLGGWLPISIAHDGKDTQKREGRNLQEVLSFSIIALWRHLARGVCLAKRIRREERVLSSEVFGGFERQKERKKKKRRFFWRGRGEIADGIWRE
ncbi:hypothetical protein VNO77_44602 [Canavalia gladiata]|uniref:Uncharacterized protein n=1 Tax=Canavalia gladiata TaxID=3824 RepID=A0AAN9PNX5_CANGL